MVGVVLFEMAFENCYASIGIFGKELGGGELEGGEGLRCLFEGGDLRGSGFLGEMG
jgi:hypothetical protein